jgi:hypothetical protein
MLALGYVSYHVYACNLWLIQLRAHAVVSCFVGLGMQGWAHGAMTLSISKFSIAIRKC